MRLYEELVAVVDALREAGIPFAICGGLAVAIHGYIRATKDIDLVVLAPDVERAKDAVRPLGFRLPALPMTFDAGTERERQVHRISKVIGEEHLTIDLLILARPDRVWEDRQVLEWEGKHLDVVSRAGLARLKRMAGRPQDLVDLEMLGLAPTDE